MKMLLSPGFWRGNVVERRTTNPTNDRRTPAGFATPFDSHFDLEGRSGGDLSALKSPQRRVKILTNTCLSELRSSGIKKYNRIGQYLAHTTLDPYIPLARNEQLWRVNMMAGTWLLTKLPVLLWCMPRLSCCR